MSATFQLWGIPTHMKGASYKHPVVILFEAVYLLCAVAFRRFRDAVFVLVLKMADVFIYIYLKRIPRGSYEVWE